MTGHEFRAALKTLGLSRAEAGRFMAVSRRTMQSYADRGPTGPAAFALRLLLAMTGGERERVLRDVEYLVAHARMAERLAKLEEIA